MICTRSPSLVFFPPVGPESDFTKNLAEPVMGTTAGATAGESQRTIGLRKRYESDFPSLSSSGCLSVNACASLPAVPGVSARVCPFPSFSAVSAAVAHARLTPMHDAHNSCSDTAINSLRVQRATSYNPQGVVAHNSRRKVRLSSTVGSRSVVQTVDMSPAPAAGTYRRSADEVHVQRQISRKRLAVSSGGGPGPGPGSGRGYGPGGGSLRPRCGLPGDSLLTGDATWASPVRTAIPRLGAGMWFWEVGSLGAKG